MKKLISAFCLAIIAAVGAFAQTTDEYSKNEFFGGFSHQQVDRGEYTSFNGFEGSYVRNVSRFFGIKGDVSGSYRNDDVISTLVNGTPGNTTTQTFRTEIKDSLYNFLGGVQVKDNTSNARFKPFGHALAGVGHFRTKFNSSLNGNDTFSNTITNTGFAAAVGGGLDIKINDRFDFRAIQADYNPIRIGDQWSNNFRFGIGIVIK